MAAIGMAVLAAGACKNKSEEQPAPKAVETKAVETKPVEKPAPEPPKALTGEGLAKWYQGCWDASAAQKWNDLSACYAEDVTATTLGMAPLSGKSTVIGDHKGFSAAFPDATFEPQLTLVSGRDIFGVRWFRGTQSGVFKTPGGDLPATNKKVSMLLLHHAQISETNQVAHEWWAYDVGTLMFQLGVSKEPGRAPLDKGWPGAPVLVIAKDDDVEHKNAAAIKQGYENFNKRDMKEFDAMMADDIVESFNNSPTDTVGKKAVQAENKGFIIGFSDMHVDVDTVWAAGDYTVGFEHVRATNDGVYGPFKKTGKKVDWTAIEIIKWKDGKVVQSFPFNNGMEFATQLGLVPTAKK